MNSDGTHENIMYIDTKGMLCCDIIYEKHWTKYEVDMCGSDFGLRTIEARWIATGELLC